MHAAVYCRSPETYETRELRFELADNMDLVGIDSKTEVNSTLLLGSSDAESFLARYSFSWYLLVYFRLFVGVKYQTHYDGSESVFLCRNEYLELPHKSCSVFPLTRGLYVVGLLLMLLDEEPSDQCKSSPTLQPMAKKESPIKTFLEQDRDILQAVKKTLASGCDLYQTAVLLKAASSAKTKFANGLLMETKGPVKVVRSMANMLHYRVGADDPEMDMVQNIRDQVWL